MKLSKTQILRYLGVRGDADARLLSLIAQLTDELLGCAAPKSVYGIWDCRVASPYFEISGLSVLSYSLTLRLAGCEQAALMAATLGVGVDTLIRMYSVRDIEKAAIAEAICAAMIEAYCDELEAELREGEEAKELCFTARFSPGYGDFDLAHQKTILDMLQCGKCIGLTLTDGYMLAPSKSVTAIIGLTKEKTPPGDHPPSKCSRCDENDCVFKETL